MNIIYGVLAIAVLLAVAWVFSENKGAIRLRTVIPALLGQICLIGFMLKVPAGESFLNWLATGVTKVLSYGEQGVHFVFGDLSKPFTFAVSVLALVCFTSCLISVLYYLRIIPLFIKVIGKVIAKLLGVGEVEAFCAVGSSMLANESPLLTKPYLPVLSRSELFSVAVGGFASVAVCALGGYALLGIQMKYLLIAVVAVPLGTMLVSKILIPQTEPVHNGDIAPSPCNSLTEAIGTGAIDGAHLAINIGAVLIGFLGLVTLVNAGLSHFGTDIAGILGFILYPIAKLFNIPTAEASIFSSLLGTKIAVNEFVAFSNLGAIIGTLTVRTQAILSVILCNFANLSVIAITTAGFKIYAPSRADEVAGFGFKALLAGVITTLITGAIVGMFI